MRIFPLGRLARGVHYRLGRYIARQDATIQQQRTTNSALRFAARTKINIGCGQDKRPDYLNIDVDQAASPDLLIVNDDDSLIPRNHFEEVLAWDILEHIPRAKTLGALLSWSDYLVDGGKLVLQTSSILGVAKMLKQCTRFEEHHGWTTCLFGNQAHSGDYHFTGFTELTLKVYLLAAGFRIDHSELRDEWLMSVRATKIENWSTIPDADAKSDAEFMREAYRRALFRDLEGLELEHATNVLKFGTSRPAALKTIYASPERLYRVSERNGL